MFFFFFSVIWIFYMGLKFRDDLYLRGLNFAIFFFTIVKNAKLKTGKLELWRETKKKFELSAIRLFFLGIAGNCTAIFIADTSSLSTDPTDSSRSGLVVALRARSRALADVFEKNEQKNKTTSVHRVHRKDMLAAWNNDCSRFLGRIKEKYIICLSNRSPTVPLGSLSTRTFQDDAAVNERLRLGLGPLRMTYPWQTTSPCRRRREFGQFDGVLGTWVIYEISLLF